MIPNASQTAEVQSTLTGERGKFSVHEHAHEKIMGVLTNLYEDPEDAAVREYLTNALDAQIEAQANDPSYVWRPIEVTTPSHFNKTYSIRDFGPGMNNNDIETIYSQYGYSTKEHTNDQTGMLGLGSKCGLTYTGQFTVVGYKGGVRTRALITLNEDEVPEYFILDEVPSDEPSGVEIQIPVRDRNSFEEKTKRFLRWWKPGQVLVNGREPEYHGFDEVKPGIYLIENSEYSRFPQSYVIMGNVPYAVDPEYVPEELRDAGLGFAAYVPMGTVDFPPSRERLRYNSRTKDAIEEIGKDLFEFVLDKKLCEVTNQPNHKEAFIAWSMLPRGFANHSKAQNLLYKGDRFITRFDHEYMALSWDYNGRGQIAERSRVHLSSVITGASNYMTFRDLGVVVTGVKKKPTPVFKKKLRKYLRDNGLGEEAHLVDKDYDCKWLDHVPRLTADDVNAIKLPRNPSATTKSASLYDTYTLDSNGDVVADESAVVAASAGQTITYVSPADIRETYRKSGCKPESLIKQIGTGYVLVVLAKNRFDKFKRAHPKAVPLADAIQARINALVAASTNAEFIVGELGPTETHFFRAVDPAELKDKDLADVAREVQKTGDTTHYQRALTLRDFARRASVSVVVPDQTARNFTDPSKEYPLISRAGGRYINHMVIYCNAVYEANNGK